MNDSANSTELKNLTIPQMLERSAGLYGGRMALSSFKSGKLVGIPYSELERRAKSLASSLIQQGVKKGDRIGLLSENRPEWGLSYLGILFSGGIVVPLDSLLKVSELKHIIGESGAKIVICSNKFVSDVEETKSSVDTLERIICMDDCPKKTALSLKEILEQEDKNRVNFIYPEPQDIASIIYTSGTTGSSKGVILTHKNIMSDIWALKKMIKFYPEDNFLSVLPLHHTLESTCGLLTPLSGGGMITYARSLKSKEILEDIRNSGATILIGVPLLYEKMLSGIFKAVEKKPFFTQLLFKANFNLCKLSRMVLGLDFGKTCFKGLRERAGLYSLRLFICGGAPLDPEIPRCFDYLGIKFLQGYGLTEAAPVLTLNPYHKAKYVSVGIAIPGAEVKISDPDSSGIGEISARGDMVMKGYYNDEDATSFAFKDGWFLTGDSGSVDKDGYFHIAGRLKNVIITRAGKNVYPEEVEFHLLKSPYILEALVLGREVGGGKGEEPYAIIVPNYEYFDQMAKQENITLSPEKIESVIKSEIAKCCDDIADYKRVKGFRIREEELEKTSTKKIKRYLYQHKMVKIPTDGK
jgi:long-chain acyl-CoA synthetase